MPQAAKRIKIRRKDLQQPDEFETLTGQVLAWVREHQSVVVGCVVAVVLGAGLALLVGRLRASRAEAAAIDFRAAHGLFQAAKYGEAAEAFAVLIERSPRTPFGRLAGLYRGHALARNGDFGGAATAYGEYIASGAASAYLRQEALVGLARAKEAGGDAPGALEAFAQAGALEGPYRTDALLGAARLHAAAGQAEEARRIYTQLLEAAPDAELKAFLQAKLGTPTPADDTQAGPEPNVR
jgi:tetratricopeptide (TPR) repeat protein